MGGTQRWSTLTLTFVTPHVATQSRHTRLSFKIRFAGVPFINRITLIIDPQPVADTGFRQDMDGPFGIRLDLLAQGPDVDT